LWPVFARLLTSIAEIHSVGVGKTFLATALGHAACRAKKRVLSLRSDNLLKLIHQSRADNSTERVIRTLLTPDLLIIDLCAAVSYVAIGLWFAMQSALPAREGLGYFT